MLESNQTTSHHNPGQLVHHSAVGRALHVVGDKFTAFASENPGVMTVSALEEMLKSELSSPLNLLIGQGVSLERLTELEALISESRAAALVKIQSAPVRDRAPGKYTHKHYSRNTIITTPEKDPQSELYRAFVVLDDNCAEMSDHVTGHHLQGVIFFEAARQMFLAATERYWIEARERPYYFVINEFNITYHTFGFPLPTEMTLEVVNERVDSAQAGAIVLDVKVVFHQVGVPITECFIKYAAFEKGLLSAREGLLSRLAIVKQSQVPTLAS